MYTRMKLVCELSVCDSFLFWAVRKWKEFTRSVQMFWVRSAHHWRKKKKKKYNNNHFGFSTKRSSLTECRVQNDLCINKHHLHRRTQNTWMCYCSIKANIWHHRISLTKFYPKCVQIIRRFGYSFYSFMLLTQPWFFCHLEKFRLFRRHESSWYNSCQG